MITQITQQEFEMENESEEDRVMRSLLSRLSFMKSDFNAIKNLNIKNKELKQLVQEIIDKIEKVFDFVFPGRLGREE